MSYFFLSVQPFPSPFPAADAQVRQVIAGLEEWLPLPRYMALKTHTHSHSLEWPSSIKYTPHTTGSTLRTLDHNDWKLFNVEEFISRFHFRSWRRRRRSLISLGRLSLFIYRNFYSFTFSAGPFGPSFRLWLSAFVSFISLFGCWYFSQRFLTLAAVDFLFCGCDYDYGCIQEVAQEPLFSLAWAFNVFFP